MRGLSSSLILVGCLYCNDNFQVATARQFHHHRRKLHVDIHHNRRAWKDLRGGQQDQDAPVETPDDSSNSSSNNYPQQATSTHDVTQPETPKAKDTIHDNSKNNNLFGMLSSIKTKATPENIQRIRKRLDARLRQIRNAAARTLFREHSSDDGGGTNKERLLSAFGPSLVAFWANRGGSSSDRLVSFVTLYALSLLGSSIGFYCFLYFITVGYALGITIPMMVVLWKHQQRQRTFSLVVSPECTWHSLSTLLHSSLIILWGLRAFFFFVWREYFNWPELHQQIKHVNQHNSPTLPVKGLIWIIYSFLYTAMLAPCWLRLEQSARLMVPKTTTILMATQSSSFHPIRWVAMYLPILLQMSGLLLETVADYQKNTFKKDHRYEWCHVGLWKWSTHPNYLGEMIFWTGTYWGWWLFTAALYLSSTSPKSLATLPSTLSWLGQLVFCTLGYFFITMVLRGSIRSMGNKHWQKYGHLPEYAAFRQSHGLLGPKWRGKNKPTKPKPENEEETVAPAPEQLSN